jgi:predicted Zn-dependent protease
LATSLAARAGAASDPLRPGKNEQLNLGKHVAVYLRTHAKVLPSSDPRVQELRDVGSRLLSNADFKGDPWEFSFDVIDDPKVVNAFSIPGGPVFVYTGLLNRIKTEDELAGIIGHEMTHVLRQHWAYAYADSEKRNLLLNIGLFALHANYTLGDLTSMVNELYDLKYSRKDETQADEGGLQMMVAAGYNPQGMVDVFTMLAALGKGKEPPEWLNDHPDDGHRVKHMEEIIGTMHGPFPGQRALGH